MFRVLGLFRNEAAISEAIARARSTYCAANIHPNDLEPKMVSANDAKDLAL